MKTLQYFGFGPSILSWIKCFYSNIESCILNNGWTTNFFEIQRGVRQGCPLSPYLFVLSVEVLAKAIRKDRNIKGILVNQRELKISQYADDATLILDGSKDSLSASLNILDKFSEISGLRLNNKKTEALWIGVNSGSDNIYFPERNFKWQKRKVKALGVWLSIDPEITDTLNYQEKLEKVWNILSCWKYRRLTLIGKIKVIKSLVASQLVYVLAPLHTNENFIKEVNKLFYLFLWNGKGDKIKRSTMINDYSQGGLKMIDIQAFNKSLKTTWIKKYLDNENQGKWKLFFDLELETLGGNILFTGNLNKKDTNMTIRVSDRFIKEILAIWSEVNFEDCIISENQFLEQSIWHNSLIRIGVGPIFYKEWYLKGITKVKHLKDEDNNFYTLSDFQNKYSLNVRPLAYYGVVSALKHLWKTCNPNNKTNLTSENECFSGKFLKSQEASRLVYNKIVTMQSSAPLKSQQKWLEDCNGINNENFQWNAAYRLASKCTKSTKLIEFQFKLLHRRIPTNEFLVKIGIKDTPQCSFCKEEPEKLIHLFWLCPKTDSFWQSVITWLNHRKIIPDNYSIADIVALGLRPDSSKYHCQVNFCFLLARHYIWLCKAKENLPRLKGFIQYQNQCTL